MKRSVDKGLYEDSINRLYDIFRDMSATVTEVSRRRCPYKNVKNQCTANFGCRNQKRVVPAGEPFLCMSNDDLDYRSAWEV